MNDRGHAPIALYTPRQIKRQVDSTMQLVIMPRYMSHCWCEMMRLQQMLRCLQHLQQIVSADLHLHDATTTHNPHRPKLNEADSGLVARWKEAKRHEAWSKHGD